MWLVRALVRVHIDCGCSGPSARQTLSWKLVALVNTREHVDSLIEANALGVDSIQTYLAEWDRGVA